MTHAAPAATGIFGGTFNPIHVGHLWAAELICEALALAEMRFVPSADPPLKRASEQYIAPAEQRLAWVKAAVADNPHFTVDDLELGREGPSYTVDTLRILGERLATPLVFVIGQDAFAELGVWREPATLLTLSHIAVMTRPPAAQGSLQSWLPPALADVYDWHRDEHGSDQGVHRVAGTWLRHVPIPALDVSATLIRERLSAGRSVRYLIPDAIREDVARSGFYSKGTLDG